MIEYAKAFCLSICRWIVDNKDGITTFIMSGQFASLIAALIMLIRQIKQVKTNTSSAKALNQTLESTNSMSTSVTELDKNFQLLKQENDYLRTELRETEKRLQDTNAEIVNKLNAIIEVQGIVYSTIRDDGVRQTVSTILNNARYSEKNFKQELEIQIEELKNTYTCELEAMNKKITEGTEKMSFLLNSGEQAKATMKKKAESTRY